MSDSEELKSCPFCGGTDVSSGEVLGKYPNGGYYKQTMCRKCCALGPESKGHNDADADAAWNTRTEAAQVDGVAAMICPNCDDEFPQGCGGIFRDEGDACWFNRKR